MLSLAFVLAFIGAAVGLLVGILIFGEVSDAISCPASGGGGGGESQIVFNHTNGEIYLGLDPTDWDFLTVSPSGSSLVSINMWVNANYSTYFLGNCQACLDADGSDDPMENNLLSNGNPNANNIVFDLHIEKGDGYSDIFADIRSGFGGGSDKLNGLSDPAPSNGTWHMITLKYDKTGVVPGKVCQDSICSPASSGGYPASASTDVLTIGSDSDHYYYTFNFPTNTLQNVHEVTMLIDDVTIWHGYTLTQTDINNLYNSGAGASAGASGLGISLPEQVGHWNFDDSTANGGISYDNLGTLGSAGDAVYYEFESPSTFVSTTGIINQAVIENGTDSSGIIIVSGGGGSPEVGSEQCESAKETAWTVIGIMPVALFFGLFSLFSAMGVGREQ